MEKKIEVITREGKTVRVMPHMLEDMALFGVTQVKKIVKETPKELIRVATRPVEVLPEMVNTNKLFVEGVKFLDVVIPPVNIPVAPVKLNPVVKVVKRGKK